MISRLSFLAIAVSLSLCTLPRQAFAQTISKWDEQEANQRFREGLDLIQGGHSEEARRKFEESYAVFRDTRPKVLWNLALAEMDSDHTLDALAHFRHWMTLPEAIADKRDLGQKYISSVAAKTGHVTVAGVATSALSIDGKAVATLPPELRDGGTYDVTPGHHIVEATIAGTSERREVDVAPGATVAIAFASPTTAPPVLGQRAAGTLGAPTGGDREPSEGSRSFWTTRTIIAAGLGGAAVAAAGFAVGFGVASQNDKSDMTRLQSEPTCRGGCDALDQARNSQREHGQLANGLYVTSGILAAGAIGVVTSVLLSPDKPSNDRAATIAPTFFASGGGLAIDGHF